MSQDFQLQVFFINQFPPSIPLQPSRILQKFAEIFAAKGTPPVSLTPVANGKNKSTKQESSVGEPDPDLHVFGPPGSGSGSLVRGTDPDPAPDPYLFLVNELSRLK